MARLRYLAEGEVEYPITAEIISIKPFSKLPNYSVAERQCLEEFEHMCQQHDWTYQMSDDHRYWVKGQEEYTELMKVYNDFQIGSMADDAKKIFEDYH